MAKQGVNSNNNVFKNVTRKKGFKIMYHHNAVIEHCIDYASNDAAHLGGRFLSYPMIEMA